MITTLILTFSSLRMAGVIALVAILSVGLGMFSLWLSGLPVGFNPLLGCAGLIGVAINGSIVVIAAINANPKAKQGDTREIVMKPWGVADIFYQLHSPPWVAWFHYYYSAKVAFGHPWRSYLRVG